MSTLTELGALADAAIAALDAGDALSEALVGLMADQPGSVTERPEWALLETWFTTHARLMGTLNRELEDA